MKSLAITCQRLLTRKKTVKLLQTAEDLEAKRIYEMEKPLSERLKVARTDAFDPLPPQLLRKVGITENCSNRRYFPHVISLF